VKRLFVTGDDFGHSRAVNRGIAEAHDRGLLTSASLMVAGEAAAEAIALARDRPTLTVGLHLVLADGRAVLPPSEIPALVDAVGRFQARPSSAGLRYQFSASAAYDLRREIRAQLERFQDSGLPLDHVDGHHHLHLHPVVLGILLDFAEEFSIPSIRLPSEELGLALALDPRGRASKILWSVVFGFLRRRARRLLQESNIGFHQRVYGLLATGRITEEYLLGLIPRIQADSVEIYCHPAAALPGEVGDSASAGKGAELAALLSRQVAGAVAESGFVLQRRSFSPALSAPRNRV
jgi:hopanoid biosynthesis associated protein HpnK